MEQPARVLPWQDVKRILASVQQSKSPGKRDFAMLMMMALYGLCLLYTSQGPFDNLIQDATLSGRLIVIMLPAQFLPVAIRTAVVGVCLLDIWNSWKVARADYLFRQDTAESIRSAISLAPDASERCV